MPTRQQQQRASPVGIQGGALHCSGEGSLVLPRGEGTVGGQVQRYPAFGLLSQKVCQEAARSGVLLQLDGPHRLHESFIGVWGLHTMGNL